MGVVKLDNHSYMFYYCLTVTPPSQANEAPAIRSGPYYILFIVISVTLFICGLWGYGDAQAASLGYSVPSGLTEHTEQCFPRNPVTESESPSNTEVWLYWITDQNADYCNLFQARQEQQKTSEESLLSEVKTLTTEIKVVKEEVSATKVELEHVKKVIESVDSHIVELGIETKPLYTTSSSSSPTSKVEVADFNSGAQTDLSEMQQNIETMGWCIIGTMVAMMICAFMFLILKPSRR